MPIKKAYRNAWSWVPSLYYAEGIPYVIVMAVSVIMYKKLGLSNTEIALYTSWLYLPWTIKPLWSPIVDLLKTKRSWIIGTQLIIAAGLGGVAFTVPSSNFLQLTLAFFWLTAFCSATHDIAADGFYMLGLPVHEQAFFVGIRSTFYRLANITGQGLLVMLAGYFETRGTIQNSWSVIFAITSGLFFLFFLYHFIILPYPAADKAAAKTPGESIFKEFFRTFSTFFRKKKIGSAIAFLLIYRFGEAQLVKLASPFLLDSRAEGGLGLTTAEVGFAYGTLGIAALMLGGILGGFLVSRDGLKKWLWWMFAAINIPHILYVYMAFFQPDNYYIITFCVAGEQFGYGLGFTAYILFLIYIAEGEFKTSHYAIATSFMALGMMIPGMFSGWIQEHLGYPNFFIWVLLTIVPAYFITRLLDIAPEFGKKKNKDSSN